MKTKTTSEPKTKFPVNKVARHMIETKSSPVKKVSTESTIFMATVLEYLANEVLELAGNEVKDRGENMIMPRHIEKVFENDEELTVLWKTQYLEEQQQ